jgi:hypothetical protein
MSAYGRTFTDIADALHRLNDGDLFGHEPDPDVIAARERFHRRMARKRRREAVHRYLQEPWSAWSDDGDAAHLARRFLSRYPDFDRPDPAYDLLTDRQAAAEYHRDEAVDEANLGDEEQRMRR